MNQFVCVYKVPDRGGRAYELGPPPPEMPSFQQRRGGPHGHRGGGGGRQQNRGGMCHCSHIFCMVLSMMLALGDFSKKITLRPKWIRKRRFCIDNYTVSHNYWTPSAKWQNFPQMSTNFRNFFHR